MISLEKAKELKEAGLLWEPCFGEWVHVDGENKMIVHVCEGEFGEYKDIRCLSPFTGIAKGLRDADCVLLPRLDQLLAEIRKYSKFAKITWLVMNKKWDCVVDGREQFLAEVPEDAAADALLWMVNQEAGAK